HSTAPLVDCVGEIGVCAGERRMLALHPPQFLPRPEIDRAETLPFATETFEPLFDLDQIRQWIGRPDFGELCDRRRLNLKHVADLAANIAQSTLGAFETLFGAGQLLARGAGSFEC